MELEGVLDLQRSNEGVEDAAITATGVIDKYATAVSAGHKLLVTPDSYHVLISFKPTISFAEKIETLVERRYVW
jgi:hypothetical protein